MPVLLSVPGGPVPSHDQWVSLETARALTGLDPARRRSRVGYALSDAFDSESETWWRLGAELNDSGSAGLAHTPACVANASDFGVMLAWTHLVDTWQKESDTTLVICADPWMFRHLASRRGVVAVCAAPLLWPAVIRMALRGLAARTVATLRLAAAAILLRRHRRRQRGAGTPVILVYGHPASDGCGTDAYFGTLMRELPSLHRVLHVDCGPRHAELLSTDGRTSSLHAWGSLWFLLVMPFMRWRPAARQRAGALRWLIRRAAAREASSGQAATISWQRHCQQRWLEATRPAVVAWPWENHAWERAFVRAARAAHVKTIGYQHSVIGRQMLNYAAFSNASDGTDIPDRILCVGEATRDQLAHWGMPLDRLSIGGALRFPSNRSVRFDRSAPVFVALPFSSTIAAAMLAAIRALRNQGRWTFLVKDHPMTPFAFEESAGIRRTTAKLNEQPAVSGVIYAATTVGLEAILSGIPAVRFLPDTEVALDILPKGIDACAADAQELPAALESMMPAVTAVTNRVFAPVDLALWACILAPRTVDK